MDLLPKATPLVIGQRLHCILYGGEDGTVIAIHGEQTPGSVRGMGAVGVSGGSATFDVIWDSGAVSRQLPEALVRASVQWRVFAEIHGAEQIRALEARAAQRREEDQQETQRAAEAYSTARQVAMREHQHLQAVQPGERASAKLAAKNLRADLKRHFPGVRFSVRSDHNSVDVSWEDGPTSHRVERITAKYQNAYFDGMQDLSVSTPTAFTDLFGGARYVSDRRSISEQLRQRAIEVLFARLPSNLQGVEKPQAKDLHSRYDRIPHLNMEVREAVNFLAYAWDTSAGRFDEHYRSEGGSWLIWDDGNVVCPALTLTSAGPGREESEPEEGAAAAPERMRG